MTKRATKRTNRWKIKSKWNEMKWILLYVLCAMWARARATATAMLRYPHIHIIHSSEELVTLLRIFFPLTLLVYKADLCYMHLVSARLLVWPVFVGRIAKWYVMCNVPWSCYRKCMWTLNDWILFILCVVWLWSFTTQSEGKLTGRMNEGKNKKRKIK